MRLSPPVLIATLATLAAAAPSPAAKPRDLWATINVCSTARSPNRVGVRARMPGNGTRERMYMRFTAEYRTASAWKTVAGRGASRWLYAGSALFRNEELGWTFPFDPPKAGSSYIVRGRVDFQWRRSRRGGGFTVAHTARAATVAGHASSFSEPPGFSAAHCTLGTS